MVWPVVLISAVAIAAILIRVVSRLDPSNEKGTGSPTNELIRHVFFALLLADMFNFNPALPLIAIFLLNIVSMHIPYPMPYMIRSRAKTAITSWHGQCSVNFSLVVSLRFADYCRVFLFSVLIFSCQNLLRN